MSALGRVPQSQAVNKQLTPLQIAGIVGGSLAVLGAGAYGAYQAYNKPTPSIVGNMGSLLDDRSKPSGDSTTLNGIRTAKQQQDMGNARAKEFLKPSITMYDPITKQQDIFYR